MTREGVAVALLHYRLAPGARYPAQAEDVAAGVALLLREAEHYGCDSKRVFLAGHCARWQKNWRGAECRRAGAAAEFI